jgi:hypothetical protein
MVDRPDVTARSAGTCAAALLLMTACASMSAPRVIQVHEMPERPVYATEWITSDRNAAAVAMAVMHRELNLPRLDVTMHFLPDRDALRQALVDNGYEPSFAEETATRLDAIAGPRRVFFNSDALAPMPYPWRAGFFAHELTHTLQYELGGGVRGASDQWIREGFADWVAGRVLDVTGVISLERFQQQRIGTYREAAELPRLEQMATFPDWVAFSAVNAAALASKAYLAVEFLVERHGVAAVLDYFGRFAASQDRFGNFAAAFGEPLTAFESAADEQLRRLGVRPSASFSGVGVHSFPCAHGTPARAVRALSHPIVATPTRPAPLTTASGQKSAGAASRRAAVCQPRSGAIRYRARAAVIAPRPITAVDAIASRSGHAPSTSAV